MVVLNAAQFLGRLIPAALTDYYGGADMLLFAQVLIGILGLHWITVATLGRRFLEQKFSSPLLVAFMSKRRCSACVGTCLYILHSS